MQELRVAAKAHYSNSPVFSKTIQAISRRVDREFLNVVNYQTFVTLVEERSRRCTSEALFRQLDRGGKGHLDQDDLLVLYYLMDTRGDCSRCNDVLRSVYYTCLSCFDDCSSPNSPPFNVCGACYHAKSFDHPQHNFFVDNFELLKRRRFQRWNWGELPPAMLQDAVAGLTVKGIEDACDGVKTLYQQFGVGELVDGQGDEITGDVVGEAPGGALENFISWLQTFNAPGHGWSDTFADVADSVLS